jgi:hypothetical protein
MLLIRLSVLRVIGIFLRAGRERRTVYIQIGAYFVSQSLYRVLKAVSGLIVQRNEYKNQFLHTELFPTLRGRLSDDFMPFLADSVKL